MGDPSRSTNTVVGLAAAGPIVVGIAAFIVALLAFFSGDYVGAGISLVAAALSFGLLSVAVYAN